MMNKAVSFYENPLKACLTKTGEPFHGQDMLCPDWSRLFDST